VAILGEPGRHARHLAPPVGRAALHLELLHLDDEIGRADRPGALIRIDLRRRHVGRVAARRAAVGPLRDGGDLVVAERGIVVEFLDADVLLDVPRRHHPGARPHAGALLDRARPRPHVFVAHQRHRRHAVRAVAVLAAALQDWRDVLRKVGIGRDAAGRGLQAARREEAQACRDKQCQPAGPGPRVLRTTTHRTLSLRSAALLGLPAPLVGRPEGLRYESGAEFRNVLRGNFTARRGAGGRDLGGGGRPRSAPYGPDLLLRTAIAPRISHTGPAGYSTASARPTRTSC